MRGRRGRRGRKGSRGAVGSEYLGAGRKIRLSLFDLILPSFQLLLYLIFYLNNIYV